MRVALLQMNRRTMKTISTTMARAAPHTPRPPTISTTRNHQFHPCRFPCTATTTKTRRPSSPFSKVTACHSVLSLATSLSSSGIQAPSQPPPPVTSSTFLSDFIHRSQEPSRKCRSRWTRFHYSLDSREDGRSRSHQSPEMADKFTMGFFSSFSSSITYRMRSNAKRRRTISRFEFGLC